MKNRGSGNGEDNQKPDADIGMPAAENQRATRKLQKDAEPEGQRRQRRMRGRHAVVVGRSNVGKSSLIKTLVYAFGAEPNSQVSLVDAAFPGMLPVLNRGAVERALLERLG